MKHSEGSLRRVFALTFEHGDLLIERLTDFIRANEVRNGYIFFLGALEQCRIVTGPKDLKLPTAPIWGGFEDGREVIGIGSVAWEGDSPRAHVHVCAGRAGDMLIGCLREEGRVHIVIEAVLLEVAFESLSRGLDERTGAHLPRHGA